ncbi:MAG: glycoside hydrolase family 18 protein [Clostridia bacterium]|nr:glycoside hydrolase family 18 protein [Clostridia bacterium]MBO4886126.1 glycoside hydrolase family 18 protein [Clostridia bacterium]
MEHYILGYVVDRALESVTREDANRLTHINLAFGVLKDNLLDMRKMQHIDEIRRIRRLNPDIRIVLSIGGWGAGGFSTMARTAQTREAFAASCLRVVEEHGLDGIDIDWEYPCDNSAEIDCDPSDRENFTHLLQALRDALGSERIVSIAAGAGHYFIEDTEMDKVAAICDYVQLMTYDIRSGFQREAGHHTGLFTSPGDRLNGSVQASVEDFMAAGVPREKIVIGAAFYSRRWDGVPNVNHGLFQMSETVGQYGPGYAQLEESFINRNGFTRYWDDDAKAPFLFNGSSLISYDDTESIRLKCEYLKAEGLKGIMYWEHGSDPSRKLLAAMWKAMGGREKA